MVPVTPSTVAMMMTSQHSCVQLQQHYWYEYLMEEWQLLEPPVALVMTSMVTMTTTLTTAVISVS